MSSNSSIRAYNRLQDYINEHLMDFMPVIDDNSKVLYDAMKYSLTAGGKRIRPILLLAAFEMCGKPLKLALPFACAVEYIHTYSLIHDDLPAMDNDDLRRGMPTCHKVYGEDIAILAGDGLLSAAFEIMNKDMLLYLDDPEILTCKVRAAFSISKGVGVRGMVAGQVADVTYEGKKTTENVLNFIHTHKTGTFIRACVKAGGYIGNADNDLLHDLEGYGENLGLAFQIVDDILDVTSSEQSLGHTIGKDSEQGKICCPAFYGLDKSIELAHKYIDKARSYIAKYYDNAEVLELILEQLESKIV